MSLALEPHHASQAEPVGDGPPPFSNAFWLQLEQAAGVLRFFRHALPPGTYPDVGPGEDADVLTTDTAAAAAYLTGRGFAHRTGRNPDQYLFCLWPDITVPERSIDLHRGVSWSGGWVWRGHVAPAWASLAHGLLQHRDPDHFRRRFTVAGLADDSPFNGRRLLSRVFYWALAHRRQRLMTLLLIPVGLRWSPRRYAAYLRRIWRLRLFQLTRGRGLEIGFSGVDGSGKSTTIACLADHIAYPLKTIYMGSNLPVTPLARLLDRRGYRGAGMGLIYALDRSVRRLIGRYWALRGRIVLYDRDPACRTQRERNPLKRLAYAPFRKLIERPVDLSVFLDGDVGVFFRRKGEHDIIILNTLRQEVVSGYLGSAQPVMRLDSSQLDTSTVVDQIGRRIHALLCNRLDQEAAFVTDFPVAAE